MISEEFPGSHDAFGKNEPWGVSGWFERDFRTFLEFLRP